MKSAVVKADDFNRALQATRAFTKKGAGTNGLDAASVYGYIRLEFRKATRIMTAIAIDGYRLATERAACEECEEDFDIYVKGNVHLPRGSYATISSRGDDCEIRCAGLIFGFEQPKGDFMAWRRAIPGGDGTEPKFKIGFNGNYLLEALQAAKISKGNSLRHPVILEFFGEDKPVVIRTNEEDVKMVLPVRLKAKEGTGERG